jgi:hypothetical protein
MDFGFETVNELNMAVPAALVTENFTRLSAGRVGFCADFRRCP